MSIKPLKSKTINFAVILAVLGVVESQWQTISPLLGDNQGLVYMIIAAIIGALRVVTTQPLSDK